MFHLKCVDQWLRIISCCPLCKQELEKQSNNRGLKILSSFLHSVRFLIFFFLQGSFFLFLFCAKRLCICVVIRVSFLLVQRSSPVIINIELCLWVIFGCRIIYRIYTPKQGREVLSSSRIYTSKSVHGFFFPGNGIGYWYLLLNLNNAYIITLIKQFSLN